MRIKRIVSAGIVLLLCVVLARHFLTWLFPLKYRAEILECCVEYELDPSWVCAVICAESKFDAAAQSHKGAIGLMQIMEETGDWVAEKFQLGAINLYRPADNIRVGCAYLSMLLKQYEGSELLALCAYNAGEGRVDEWLNEATDSTTDFLESAYDETRAYVDKIERYHKVYQWLYWRNTK